jgi:hypothetical protein
MDKLNWVSTDIHLCYFSLTRQPGNVAMSLLHQRTGTEREDVKCVGRILKEVMEPGDFRNNPNSRVLKYPAEWSDHLRKFLAATQTSRLQDLQNVRCPMPRRMTLLIQ